MTAQAKGKSIGELDPAGQEKLFVKFEPEARALPEERNDQRGDAELALQNVVDGYLAVISKRTTLAGVWPAARIDRLARAVELAHATVFAAWRASRARQKERRIRERIAEGYDAREKVLASARMLGVFGIVPLAQVEAIEAGSGPLDMASDLTAAVTLHREHWTAIGGRTAVTAADLAAWAELGRELAEIVRPTGAPEATDPEADAAIDLANRFWSLLAAAHKELRAAGFEIWGERVGSHVRPLQSRLAVRPATPVTPAPAPAPAS